MAAGQLLDKARKTQKMKKPASCDAGF